MKPIIILFILLICISCEDKSADVTSFKYLDIEDAYGIILGKYISGQDTALKLFKLTDADNLKEINYLGSTKVETYSDCIPVSMNNINSDYILVNFERGTEKILESYLVRRFDGYAEKLPQSIFPENNGEEDMDIECIRKDQNSGYYWVNSSGNWKLEIKSVTSPVISPILPGENLGNFCVDYIGNIIGSQKVYLSNGTNYSLDNSPVIPVNSFANQMYYLFRKGDSIQCAQLDISLGTVGEKKLLKAFKLTQEESILVGSNAFSEVNKIVVVMSKAILQIEGTSVKSLNIASLNLKTIMSCRFTNKYYFIYGENPVNDKIFIRLDPSGINTVYTQILAPNTVRIDQFSANQNNSILFTATRISDSKKLFGYIPFEGNTKIIEDDKGVSESQVLVK
jgi:hypothetical protein